MAKGVKTAALPASEYDNILNEASAPGAIPSDEYDDLLKEVDKTTSQKKSPVQTTSPEKSVSLPGGGSQNNPSDLYTTDKTTYVDSVLDKNKHLDWVQRLYDKNPETIQIPGEPNPSTHYMSDNGSGYVFPTIVKEKGHLKYLGDKAEDYARETNTGIQLPKEQGTWFANNGYKQGTNVLKGFENNQVDPRQQTAEATNIFAQHIIKTADNTSPKEYVDNLKNIPFDQPGSVIHDNTDPHGDPTKTGAYAKYAVEQLKLEKQSALQKLALGGGPNVDPDYQKEAKEISDNYDKQIADMQNAAHHIISLQQVNRDVTMKTLLPAQAKKNAWDVVTQRAAAIDKSKNQQELNEAENSSKKQLEDIHNDTKYHALKLGMEQQQLLGNKTADDDLLKLKNGQPIPDERRVQYQSVGYDAMQVAAKNAKANGNDDLAKEMESHSSDPQKRLHEDNPKYFGKLYGNQIGDYVYNNIDNPLYGTLFTRPDLTEEEVKKYGKAAGLTKDQLALVKPEDVPTASSVFGQAAQGAANAFSFGSGDGIFTGKTPQAQHGFGNPRAIIGEIAGGAGTVAGFMAQGGLIGEGLKGAEVLGDVALNAKRYQTASNMIPLALSNYSNAYQQSKQVIGDKPEDEIKRQSYAVLNGIISTAIMSIDPVTKLTSEAIFQTPAGEKFIKATIGKGLENVAPEEFQTKLQTFLQKLPQQTESTLKHAGSQAAIMGTNKAAENITNILYDPEHRHGVMDNVADAAIGGGISMFIPSLLHGMHAADNPVNKSLVWDIGNKAKEYDNLINEQRRNGTLTDDQAAEASNFVGKSEAIIKNQVPQTNLLTGKELTTSQKQDYAWNLMRNEDLNKKLRALSAGDNPDKSQVKLVNDKLSELAAERTEILNNAGLTKAQVKAQPKQETAQDIANRLAKSHYELGQDRGSWTDEDKEDNQRIKDNPSEFVDQKIEHLKSMVDAVPESEYYKEELEYFEKVKTRLEAAEARSKKNNTENKEISKEPVSLSSQDQTPKTTEDEKTNGYNVSNNSENANEGQEINAKSSAEENGTIRKEGRKGGQLEDPVSNNPNKTEAGTETSPALPVSAKDRLKALRQKAQKETGEQEPAVAPEAKKSAQPEIQFVDSKEFAASLPKEKVIEIKVPTREKPIESFETAQGSKYTYGEDGRTQRIKSSGVAHEPQDLTVFAKFKDEAQQQRFLSGVQEQEKTKTKVYVIDKDGNKYNANADVRGKDVRLALVDAETGKVLETADTKISPEVGYNTFDQRRFNKDGESYRESHIGNEVSKINYAEKEQPKETEKPNGAIATEASKGQESSDNNPIIIHRGIEGKKETFDEKRGGFYTPDIEGAQGYAGKEGHVDSRQLKPDAKVLKLMDGDPENYSPNKKGIKEFEKITGVKIPDGDITEALWGEPETVAKLKEAGYDAVVGTTMDGYGYYLINHEATERLKTENDASTQSKEQQQIGGPKGGEPEHERIKQAGSEATPAETKNSNSDQRGEKKETLTPKAQAIADKGIGEYNAAHGGKWQKQEQLQKAAIRNVAEAEARLSKAKEGTQAYTDAAEELAGYKAIQDHIESKPPQRSSKNQSKRGSNPTAQQKERKEILEATPVTVDEWAKQQLLAMSDSRPEDKFDIKSVEKDLATKSGSEERTYVGKFAHEEGTQNIDKWANAIADDPKRWPEGLNLSDPQEIKETVQQLLTDYEKKGDLQKELSDIFSEREDKRKAAEEFWADRSEDHKRAVDLMPESPEDVKTWLSGDNAIPALEVVDNASLTHSDAQLLGQYFDSIEGEDGKPDMSKVDVFGDEYTQLRDKLSKDGADLLDMALNPKKTESIVNKIKNAQDERQPEKTEPAIAGGYDTTAEGKDVSPHGGNDNANGGGEEEGRAARLKEIDKELTEQRAVQSQIGNKRLAADKAKDLEAFNKHNANWNKKQERIEKLEEERSAIQSKLDKEEQDANIQKSYNDFADKLEAKYKKNRDKHNGEALSSIVGLSTKIGDHVMDYLVARVADAIRGAGNLHIAARRAIRLTKERFGEDAKDLTYDDVDKIKDYAKDFYKPLRDEPKLPVAHEEYAKAIREAVHNGDMTYEEALKEVEEFHPENDKGEPVSDNVADNARDKIMNYLDWHHGNEVTSIKNDTTRLRRAQLGLDEEVPAAKKEFGKTWDEAKGKIEQNPQLPLDLIEELSKKARPLTDVENAVLLHQQNTKEIELMGLNDKINKASEEGDTASRLEYKVAKSRVLDELQKIYDVNKAVGTENARGLASRKMMVDRKYSLVNMIAEKRATANDGQPLSEEQQTQIEDLHKKIKETQDAFDNYVKDAESQIIDLQRQAIAGPLKDKKRASTKLRDFAQRIRNAAKNQAYSSPIPITPHMVADAIDLIAAEVEKGEKLVDLVKQAVGAGSKNNPGIDDQHLEKEINKALIESGILEPTPERKKASDMGGLFAGGRLDREAVRLKVEADRAKSEYDINLKRDAEKQLSTLAKAQNLFVKWQRAFKLSNPLTIGKLFNAGFTRLITTPLEDIVGGAYSTLLPQLAKGAIGEGGGLNINETASAYKRGLIIGMKDASEIMSKGSHGKSELDVLFGKAGDLPPEMIDFFGQLHSATKAPFKRAIFERSLERRLRRNLAAGTDITDPMVQTSIMTDAYKDANRAIFMQDNKVAEGWQKMVQHFNKVDPKTGKAPAKYLGTAMQWLVPFVKVPTNIAAEIGTNVYGAPVGAAKLLHAAFTNGIKNIPDDQKEIILRSLKKGSLGIAAMSLGYFNPQSFGGYFQPGQKRKEDDAEAMGLKLFGEKLPAWLVESPIFQAMQIGATVRRVKDEKVKSTEVDPETGVPIQESKGIGEGLWAGVSGMAQTVPLASQPVRVAQLFGSQKNRDYYLGELAKSTVDPAIVTYLAKVTDPADEGSIARKILAPENRRVSPKTLVDHIKSGLPYLREDLAEKPKPQEVQSNETIY